jgi:hypothetical protein
MILHSLNPGRKRITFYFKTFKTIITIEDGYKRWLEVQPEFAAKNNYTAKIQLLELMNL